ncbi:MAG: Cys-tRNA(Pro) deacylase [Ignavibacteriales bacterium]|jgi:ybaK/ebsC protein|nr:MAG: Cys-tRNA(Pro) deacylase [Ignavibacteriaceae bacterium]MBW7872180.1 Cys-tRNA(Pro) deacylase [Ignavibacteria bacterium]MCZ2143993.1 Cys-tRNA(Pro) deacylase [Ignavibacteriales bacterium]MBV6445674.1 Cys-tRNA(Pro)/Cys-tRNA(Cys) deacylase YbaK [Ignavibacteriaceae bacterium]MBZ0197353.1 Cys-tRNA(Pro) deacylase [Ignavibacteriaceae bacterium]
MSKTNAIRLLERMGVKFNTISYPVSEEELDAVSVAKKVGLDPDTVFKTLVARNEANKIFVFIIPGPYELDLKKAAKSSGSKRVEMVKVKELFDLTGYIRGGCSPIGMKKHYPSFIDETAFLFDQISVSAGERGTQIILEPTSLVKTIEAKVVDLI